MHITYTLKFIILIFLTSILSFESIAQESEFRNYSTINAFSLIGPYHSLVDIDIGRKITDRFYLELGFAPILSGFDWSTGEVGREDDKGAVLKIEPKFIHSESNSESAFISLKIYRTWHNYVSARYKDSNLDVIVRYQVQSRVVGVIPQYGFFINKNRMRYEVSVGYGIRRLNITNDYSGDIDDLSARDRQYERFEPEKPGIYYRGSLAINWKFGFCF